MILADKIMELRKGSGWSQEDLAEQLGVSRQAVSKWERAESSPDTDNLLALARLYGVSLDALLLHTPAGEAAQAAPEPEEAPADEDAEIFAAARAWDAAEEAEQKARKRARAKWKEGLLWLLTLALMVILPNLTYWLGISEVYAVVVTYCLGAPSITIVPPLTVNGLFGEKDYGTIVGVMNTATSIGGAFGGMIAARVYDATGSYVTFWVIAAVFVVVSALIRLLAFRLNQKRNTWSAV